MVNPRRRTPHNPPTGRNKTKRRADEDLPHNPKREVLYGFSPTYSRGNEQDDSLNNPLHKDPAPPDTPMQALMEAPPNHEPAESALEIRARSEQVIQMIDALDNADQELVDMLFYRRLSFREAAVELGAPNHVAVFRRWVGIQDVLRSLLGPMIEPKDDVDD